MSLYELKNQEICITVESLGAELKSLKKLDTDTEYMWCADARYWNRTSPILFPFVGSAKDKKYRTKGQTYSMTQHGFARDMEFELLSRTETELWFGLGSNEETLEKYPYAFFLKLGYRLEGNKVAVLWQVENPGAEPLPFSIGGHPAFNCPIREGEARHDYFLDFGDIAQVNSTRISENGLALNESDTYPLDGGRLALTDCLFDHDALVIEDNQTATVSLCRPDKSSYIKVTMDAPLFGVWSPAGSPPAPFVCIEPWHGRCDGEDFTGTLEERKWGNRIAPGEVWNASYTIEVS